MFFSGFFCGFGFLKGSNNFKFFFGGKFFVLQKTKTRKAPYPKVVRLI